jgi:hypothetical protein
VFDKTAADKAWSKRRDGLDRLGDVGDVLSDVDRADRRVAAPGKRSVGGGSQLTPLPTAAIS